MKLIPTFCDHDFHGYETIKGINRLKSEAHELARLKQETEKADHMIYGYFHYDDEGNITTARLYSGVPKTDEQFEKIAFLEKVHIYAIHNHK